MKSRIQDPESRILSPVYFPFTFISLRLVEAMSLCFERLVCYKPAFTRPEQALQPWVDKGYLELRSPFENVIDRQPIEAALTDFKNWGRIHRDADMTYLKMVARELSPVHPEIPRISSGIRGRVEEPPKGPDEGGLSLQLFLHLAQEYDRDSWELKEELDRVSHQYHSLQSAFRHGQNGEADESIPIAPPRVAGEDLGNFMIEKRMAAWNHLFQNDPTHTGLLFTDSRSAFDYLLDKVDKKVGVMKFDVTCNRSGTDEVPGERAVWADHLMEIFNTLLTMPWNRTLQEEIGTAVRELEVRIDQWNKLNVPPKDRSISFHWYMIPDLGVRRLLNRCCGLEDGHEEDRAGPAKNILAGLIDCPGSQVSD